MKNRQVFITVQLKERKNHDRNRRLEDKVMGRKKEELSIFEQMGGTYMLAIIYNNMKLNCINRQFCCSVDKQVQSSQRSANVNLAK